MTREYGLLCPDGHGVLLETDEWTAKGVAWCPNAEHDVTDGTSGRFFRRQEVVNGTFDSNQPRQKGAAIMEREAQAKEAERQRQEVWDMAIRKASADKAPKAARVRAVKEGKDCGCGCGGQTKGGRFIPGHDARFHSRVKLLVAAGIGHDEAERVAGKGPLTGKYAAITAKAETVAEKPAKAEKPKAAKAEEAAPAQAVEGEAVLVG